MKKYLIIFLILFILLEVFSMDILGRSMIDIQRRMVGQTNYRINVVNGIIESANINDTFNCYIAGESVIYPSIPTFSRKPKLQPGDKVTIEFINGCRETPVILAPEDIRERPDTTPLTVEGEIFISYWTGAAGFEVGSIRSFSADGALGTTWGPEEYHLLYNGVCVDSSGNVFYVAYTTPHKIIKFDSSGNILTSINVSYQVRAIAIANDGYIYTHEFTTTDNNMIIKRDPATLGIISSFQLDPWTNNFYGFAFYDNDRFYIVNSTSDNIEMWKVSTGAKIAQVAVTASKTTLTSLAVAGSTVLGTDFANDPWYVPTNLGAGEIDWAIGITRCFGVASKDGFFYVLGNLVNGGIIKLGKYTEGGILVWLIDAVEAGYYPSSVGAYPF